MEEEGGGGCRWCESVNPSMATEGPVFKGCSFLRRVVQQSAAVGALIPEAGEESLRVEAIRLENYFCSRARRKGKVFLASLPSECMFAGVD